MEINFLACFRTYPLSRSAFAQFLNRSRDIVSSRRRHHCSRLHFCVLRAVLCFYAFAQTIDIHFARANVCRKRKEIWSALSRTGTRWVYYSANMARIRGRLDALQSHSMQPDADYQLLNQWSCCKLCESSV